MPGSAAFKCGGLGVAHVVCAISHAAFSSCQAGAVRDPTIRSGSGDRLALGIANTQKARVLDASVEVLLGELGDEHIEQSQADQ